MRCEACSGTGWQEWRCLSARGRSPCPECGGCGLAHCCDGQRSLPEGDPERRPGAVTMAFNPGVRAKEPVG